MSRTTMNYVLVWLAGVNVAFAVYPNDSWLSLGAAVIAFGTALVSHP